jgi:transketolase
MLQPPTERVEDALVQLSPDFAYWDKTREIIDQVIDVMLNYRQSGHPGGSRSKVYPLLTLLLSGAMRWDIRHPEKRFGDRFVLGAGHTVPLIYCTLAVLNESLRLKHAQTGDPRYALPWGRENTLFWEDLLKFRRHGGLPGHAEMEGKTLFLKFNTGPSGLGNPAAVGEALALKRAGVGEVKVFFIEGEGGLTPGASHESMNSAWGLALDNLYHIVDWNDYGIDSNPISSVVYGKPVDWYGAHGWRVFGTERGEDWEAIAQTLLTMTASANPERQPSMSWIKTRKGRGYLKYDTRPTARLIRSTATSTGIPSASSPRNTMWRSPTSAARPPQMPARARPSSRPTCRP